MFWCLTWSTLNAKFISVRHVFWGYSGMESVEQFEDGNLSFQPGNTAHGWLSPVENIMSCSGTYQQYTTKTLQQLLLHVLEHAPDTPHFLCKGYFVVAPQETADSIWWTSNTAPSCHIQIYLEDTAIVVCVKDRMGTRGAQGSPVSYVS